MASKRGKRRKACGDKVRHESRAAAREAMRKVGRGRVGAYHCQFCGGWHWGHTPYQQRVGSDRRW